MAADGVGSFALVLHTHLPFVLGHGRWPHGSDWLMEVAAGCYLPLLDTEESIALQLRVAVAAHRRHFGRAPDGIWLPECAYRPRYEWTPPVGPHKGGGRVRRRGIEEFMADAGLKFFITDVHLMR